MLARAAELFLSDGEVCIESEHPILPEISSYLQQIADRLVASGLQVECVVPYRAPAVEIGAFVGAVTRAVCRRSRMKRGM